MLSSLEIRDILIIDRLALSFQPGLNVLTGETGAGKSILLDALGFVLGWRGRADLVRSGAAQGEVTAVFDLPGDHPALAVLDEAGIPPDDALILRRINTAEGRKTAYVNDRRSSGDVLRKLSAALVELHGQHDDRGLLNTGMHRALLDAYGGHSAETKAVAQAWRAWAEARNRLDAAQADLAQAVADEEFLRHAATEFAALQPEPGEDAVLDGKRRMMQSGARMREDVAKAHAALGGQGAEGMVSDAMRWLDSGADDALDAQLAGPRAALERALTELGEAEQGIAQLLDVIAVDPAELERVEERLFAIRALARKHGVAPDDLAAFGEGLDARLRAFESGAADIKALKTALVAAEADYDRVAARLTEARIAAATRLDAAMAAELAPLKMERAIFTTLVERDEPGAAGQDAVTFMVAPNPGAPAGALNRIASGGELSRFLLGLKVCLTGVDSGRTLIFDEIDRGVGGATADAVGRRLAALAGHGQVLVVTHSPQVAARGAHHWQVAKRVDDGQTLSAVTPLQGDGRVDEIARMLAGDTVTDEARSAARALLAG
ncbi:MAG: DNA repair protein RecN [Pseudomonadota bacterium]